MVIFFAKHFSLLGTCGGTDKLPLNCTYIIIKESTGIHMDTVMSRVVDGFVWGEFFVAQRISIQPPPVTVLLNIAQTYPCVSL